MGIILLLLILKLILLVYFSAGSVYVNNNDYGAPLLRCMENSDCKLIGIVYDVSMIDKNEKSTYETISTESINVSAESKDDSESFLSTNHIIHFSEISSIHQFSLNDTNLPPLLSKLVAFNIDKIVKITTSLKIDEDFTHICYGMRISQLEVIVPDDCIKYNEAKPDEVIMEYYSLKKNTFINDKTSQISFKYGDINDLDIFSDVSPTKKIGSIIVEDQHTTSHERDLSFKNDLLFKDFSEFNETLHMFQLNPEIFNIYIVTINPNPSFTSQSDSFYYLDLSAYKILQQGKYNLYFNDINICDDKKEISCSIYKLGQNIFIYNKETEKLNLLGFVLSIDMIRRNKLHFIPVYMEPEVLTHH